MNSNSYIAVKDDLFRKLSKVNGPLPPNKIEEEVGKLQLIIKTVGNITFANILSIDEFFLPTNQDWQRITRELEMHFDIKMVKGILIQGDEQKDRDTTWWSNLIKQKTNKYYWNRLERYLELTLPTEVVKIMDTDTDIVMDNIENPSIENFSRYGMVVGHVQSGKTGNYSSLICKAADAGYRFFVVISGDKNNLRNQTQERLNESFIGQTKGVQVGAGKGNSDKQLMPYSLTTVERDFNKKDADVVAQSLNFDNIKVPILLVIKKNGSTLENVIGWLQQQYKNKIVNHAMLVIDDESDYASINTNSEDDPTSINKKIRRLLNTFQKSAYVAYTATPYANIFIDHAASTESLGKDLFPKDFIYALDAPSNYFGARKIFLDSHNKHLIPIFDWDNIIPFNHKKDLKIDYLPDSLLEAIRLFTVAIGIRYLRGQGNKHSSMLVHATRFTEVHKVLATKIERYLKHLKSEIEAYGKLANSIELSHELMELNLTLNKHFHEEEFEWFQVINSVTDIVESIIVREVHQKTVLPLEYRKDITTNVIVIGGTSVSRGFTLEGLCISYFLRNTVFYDTLMQMGRWFGYRPGYYDLCRIYMPQERIDDFAEIIRGTEELYEDFRIMATKGCTPNDFGLAVKENPNSALQVTARNKQKNVKSFYYSMKLDGRLKETCYLRSNPKDIEYNLNLIRELCNGLDNTEKKGNSIIWRNIDKQKVKDFLKSFKTFENDRLGLSSRMPIAFIEKFTEERDTKWDISLHAGKGTEYTFGKETLRREERKFTIKENHFEIFGRQVSSESAEAISLVNDYPAGNAAVNRKTARSEMIRPLLMLHIIEPTFYDKQNNPVTLLNIPEIGAFGISFPGDVTSQEQTIKLKINTVYFENLLKDLESENESND